MSGLFDKLKAEHYRGDAGRARRADLVERAVPPRPQARRTDPPTSHAAAASIPRGHLRPRLDAVWRVLAEHGPMTDPQLIAAYAEHARGGAVPEQSESGIRTRRKELVQLGEARDTGMRVRLPSGRRAILWAAGPAPGSSAA